MPSLKSIGHPLGAVGSMKNFVNVVKEVDFEEIRSRAEHAPNVLVLSESEDDAREAAVRLLGERPERYAEVRAAGSSIRLDGHRYDAIVVFDPTHSRLLERTREAVGTNYTEKVYFLADSLPGELVSEDQTRAEIVATQIENAPAYGRFFPTFRSVAAKAIMDETARANAKFAVVSNVPTLIPVLGNLIAVGADLVVLTKNQIMMCYKLAALNGRDLHDHTAIITELAPVVGAGFLWRTAAREATALLPFAAGTVPKVVIAYAGTMAVGWSADFYFRFGKKPTRDQLNDFMKRATEMAKGLPMISRKNQSDGTSNPVEVDFSETPTERIPPSSPSNQ